MLWTPGEEAYFQDFGRQFDQLIMDRWKSRLRMVKPPEKKRANENLVALIGASDVHHFRNHILLLEAGRTIRMGNFCSVELQSKRQSEKLSVAFSQQSLK